MNHPGRLPLTTRPRRYELLIAPDLDASTFSGEVVIALELTEPTDTIMLHAKALDVALVELRQGGAPVAATLTTDAELEQLVITADRALSAGDAVLELQFDGPISHGLLGFYRSTYVDEAGADRVLAATQFEAPHARAAFPCFDEPEFKATFAITLVVADGLLALSNGPEIDRAQLPDGNVRVRFGETIPMSTYLVAWVVGPLEVTEPVDAGGVAVRVAYVPGRGHLTRFALDVGTFAITFFADYYGIAYPGEKCDLVALPDFSFGAMENLGCVTFRETRLLLDPDAVTLDEMSAAALTIVHEIAHMWFGDLVTMKWWNGIWLNEAFATFMEHLGVDAYKPEWKTWDEFALGRAAALDVDALENTRTVEYEVVTPEDADGMFDLLTYQKGGSVLRMLERWLGADAFRAGVRHYLDRYQLANTETTDLWDALEEATGKPVRRIMDTWIFQPGLPGGADRRRRDRAVALLLRRRRARREVGAPGAGAGAHRVAVGDALVALRREAASARRSRRRARRAQRRRRRLLPRRVSRPRGATVSSTPACWNRSNGSRWSTTCGPRCSPATRPRPSSSSCARRFADETDPVVWRAVIGHLRARRPGSSKATRWTACAPRSRRSCGRR